MTILIIMLAGGAFLFLGGKFYAPVIGKVLGEKTDRMTPAVTINDGRDYVPTKTPVVFAHHFASIAGAGPIVGPGFALLYGWGPALFWILIGGVFLGAVHDFVATHIAMREGGKNLTVIARRYLGPSAFTLMLVLLIALLALVCAAFLDLSAKALTSKVAVSALHMDPDQKTFRMEEDKLFSLPTVSTSKKIKTIQIGELDGGVIPEVLRQNLTTQGVILSDTAALVIKESGRSWILEDEGYKYHLKAESKTAPDGKENVVVTVYTRKAIIGGIASTSVVVITLCSPLIGFLYLKRKWPVWVCSLLAIGICGVSILIGLKLPMSVKPDSWKLMISGYVLISAGLPVWLFLQSRDFINVHILYVGMGILLVALMAAAIRGGGQMAGTDAIPFFNWSEGSERLGPGWPAMFVIIACGAVSGFHSLCAGGTTCKQLNNEKAARHVGYYSMLLESFLAVSVVCCLIVGLSLGSYRGICHPLLGVPNKVLTFAMGVGYTFHVGLGIPIAAGSLGAMLLLEGFLVTTLDTAIRLTRYMFEEGWATFFGRYDVFAESKTEASISKSPVEQESTSMEVAGTGGLGIDEPHDSGAESGPRVIQTSGIKRRLLRLLNYYWVNSGLAVFLMLFLATYGFETVWPIFGSSNQLLAALALLVGTTWLIRHGRPVWYTVLPAVFMLCTSLTMMVWLLFNKYIPAWPKTAPLAVADILILVLTGGILGLTVRRWIAGFKTETHSSN